MRKRQNLSEAPCGTEAPTLASPLRRQTRNRFFANLNELAELRQSKFDLPLALCPRGARLRLSRSGGAGCTLAANGGGAGNCR